ncbi:MAG: indole-3-glycerol-phosphate synthase, partial [Lachnospiraceae bacterium]|nr:indole-3-glycerol-phosphate synthase [Lachnospiraceae bacterium]
MILDDIVASTKKRVEQAKRTISLEEMKKRSEQVCKTEHPSESFRFEKALRNKPIAFICEVKKASPSKGLIAEDFDYVTIAKEYEAAGASCISVLTEPEFFQGDNKYLTEIRKNVSIPIIRKDFTIDEYQIYEAKEIGADAILLICAILTEEQIKQYLEIADSLGLSAIVEAHDEEEVKMA